MNAAWDSASGPTRNWHVVQQHRSSAMAETLGKRWLRGLGLSIYAYLLLGIAWSPLLAVHYLDQDQTLPEWLRLGLGLLSVAVTLVLCPLAFEWLTRRFGITMAGPGESAAVAALTGPRVPTTPAGDGKKRCGGCGAVVNVYAVRCLECKAVFAEADAVDR
jgi:hypothetical protein